MYTHLSLSLSLSLSLYIYIYITINKHNHAGVCIYIYIYIHMKRERERERESINWRIHRQGIREIGNRFKHGYTSAKVLLSFRVWWSSYQGPIAVIHISIRACGHFSTS